MKITFVVIIIFVVSAFALYFAFGKSLFKPDLEQVISEAELIKKHQIRRKEVYLRDELKQHIFYQDNGLPELEVNFWNKNKLSELTYDKGGFLIRKVEYSIPRDDNQIKFIIHISSGSKSVQVFNNVCITEYFPDGREKSSETIHDNKYREYSQYHWSEHNTKCKIVFYDFLGKETGTSERIIQKDEYNNPTYTSSKSDGLVDVRISKYEREYKNDLIIKEKRFDKSGELGVFELFTDVYNQYNSNFLVQKTIIYGSEHGSMYKYEYNKGRIVKEKEFELDGTLKETKSVYYNSEGLLSKKSINSESSGDYEYVYKYYNY